MKLATWIMAILITIIGCSRAVDMADDSGPAAEVIQAENGNIYSVDCLRAGASRIAALGSSAMETCRVEFSLLPASNASIRGTYRAPRGPNYIVYYPPNYYSPNYNAPAPTIQNNSTNNFCSYVFGSQWSTNCFSTFGYTPNYSNNYVPSCNSCTNGWNNMGCSNRCYYRGPVYQNSYQYIPQGGSYPYGYGYTYP